MTFTLTDQELKTIVQALMQVPYMHAAPVLASLDSQRQAQMQDDSPAAE